MSWRAPNISELFAGRSQTFPTNLDPCRGLTTSGGQAAFTKTRANLTNPSAVAASGVDTTTIGSDTARAGGAGKERKATSYTVRRGDTLYSISRKFGVSVRAVQSWNNMGGRTMIHPGNKLTIYR